MKTIPGINIQWPWSRELLSGKKRIETRTYPIPKQYLHKKLALIETPGPFGKKNGITRARILGTITFSSCKIYLNKKQWWSDFHLHLVTEEDRQFRFRSNKPKWGWIVSDVQAFESALGAPCRRGIIFAKRCNITKGVMKARSKKQSLPQDLDL